MSIAQFNSILNDSIELLKLSRKGIPYSIYEAIANAGSFTLKDWSRFLHLTERTIQRYKKDRKTFDPIQSERIIDIARLQKKGKEVFGTSKNFEVWLKSNIVALGGVRPIEFLDSSFGIDILMDELGRIEHGILA